MMEEFPLSAGLPRSHKVVVVIIAAFCGLVFVPLVALVMAVSPNSTGGLSQVASPLGVTSGVLILALIWALLRVFRSGAAVQGTELVVRSALRNRRVDLSTARILRLTEVTNRSTAVQIPVIEVHGDAQGRSAKFLFWRARAGFVPLSEVEAIVAAIRAGHGWRDELATEQAERFVQDLYQRGYAPHPGIG